MKKLVKRIINKFSKQSPLEERLKLWLGSEGKDFFTEVKLNHGTILAVFYIPYGNNAREPQRYYPHSVHFNEGRDVRNWLRKQPECSNWTTEDFDNKWAHLVEAALDL